MGGYHGDIYSHELLVLASPVADQVRLFILSIYIFELFVNLPVFTNPESSSLTSQLYASQVYQISQVAQEVQSVFIFESKEHHDNHIRAIQNKLIIYIYFGIGIFLK